MSFHNQRRPFFQGGGRDNRRENLARPYFDPRREQPNRYDQNQMNNNRNNNSDMRPRDFFDPHRNIMDNRQIPPPVRIHDRQIPPLNRLHESFEPHQGRMDNRLQFTPPPGRPNLQSPNRGHTSKPNNPPPPGLQKNSFSKFRNLQEFKDFRRNLKKRRSSSADDENAPFEKRTKESHADDFIFISSNDILELKDDIYLTLRKQPANPEYQVEEVCRSFARFQYNLGYKDYNLAKASSKMKTVVPKQALYYSCKSCDCYFTDRNILDMHLKSGLHQQVTKIDAEVQVLGKEYLQNHTNPNSFLAECQISEKVGMLINLKAEHIDCSNLDVTAMEQDAFVLAALEKRMERYWPHPQSQYFCRCCNYSEFASQVMLDRHMQSARHLAFNCQYDEAFCIICQHHYGDSKQMRAHAETKEHNKASHLMEFTKRHATEYWKCWHSKDKSAIPEYRFNLHTVSSENSERANSLRSSSTEKLNTESLSLSPLKKEKDEVIRVPFVDENELSPKRSSEVNETANSSSDNFQISCASNTSKSSVVETQQSSACTPEKDTSNLDAEKGAKEQVLSPPKDPTSLDIDRYKDYVMGSCTISDDRKEKEEQETQQNSIQQKEENSQFDEYIVPLTGFMCTVCHETLADKEEALKHKATNIHSANIKTHTLLFGP